MKVIVVFEFEEVDVDSEQADQIISEIGESCETMGIGFGASACYVELNKVGEPNESKKRW